MPLPHNSDPVTERLLEELLVTWLPGELTDRIDTCGTPVEIVSACTFADAGVLTLNHGAQVELSDGSIYQLTIHTYRHATTTTAGVHPVADPRDVAPAAQAAHHRPTGNQP